MKLSKVWIGLFLVLFSCQESLAATIAQDVDSESYQWKTGSWSACDSRTRCGEGHKTRRVWCVNSSEFIVSNTNCDRSTRPFVVKQCFTVCESHKFELSWKVGHWTSCESNMSTDCSEEMIISGVAHRTVECVLLSTQLVVDDEACGYFWDRPESQMACSMDCEHSCVTVKKNISCNIEECSEQISWTEEVNEVIVAPNHEKSRCSNVDEPVCRKEQFIDSCTNFEKEKEYKIKIGSWSPCVSEMENSEVVASGIKTALRPVFGFAKRNMTCIDENGLEVNMRFCKIESFPPLVRHCVVPVHCVVSPWGEWHVKEEGCVASDGQVYPEKRIRRRSLLQLPIGVEAKPCPFLFEERSVETGLLPCNKYQWYPLEWTDCQVILHGQHGEVTILKPTCGNGLQYRNLTCLKTRGMIPVDDTLCKDPQPFIVQRCKVPCRRHCQVSHWAKWGPCMPHNNTDFIKHIGTGYRRRVRSVLVSPSNGGEPCPHLEEVDFCERVEIFNWRYGNWSDCAITNPRKTCGRGTKERVVTCVNYNGVPLDYFMCKHHIPLIGDTDECRINCPDDCIMSDWSEWSECSVSCSTSQKSGFHFRNRTVLAIPGEGGRLCRGNRNRDSCNKHSCKLYKWETSNWSSCTPIYTNAIDHSSCGLGVQNRVVACKKGNKSPTTTKMCKYMTKPDEEQQCHLPCPVDCIVSNFSEWSSCNRSCDSDTVRYRLILQSPKHKGMPCPDALVEAKPCSSSLDPRCLPLFSGGWKNGYHWNIGNWSRCQLPLENQVCGMGFQIRNISCQNAANQTVEANYCLPNNWTNLPDGPLNDVPSGFRSCEVLCSSNCIVSAWSSWSKCSYKYRSTRTRSRELVGSTLSGNKESKCQLKLIEKERCPVIPDRQTDSVDNHWMSCIVERENRTSVAIGGQFASYACGNGYRYKVGLQMYSEEDIEPGLQRDFCFTDCPVDCQMNEWSEWSECKVPCGQGFRERTRRILVIANHLGRACPETVNNTEIQTDVCHIVCNDYRWLAGGWTNCSLEFDDDECGNGTHYRSVRCWNSRTDQEAEEARCDPLLKPPSFEACQVFCPGECVVSSWHISKKCSEPCSNESHQEMRRIIYRHPNATASPCPPLEKKIPCVINSTCHNHTWILGPWGSCVLPEGAYCGEGVKKRPLICLRNDGRQVEPIECEKTHKSLSLSEPISEPCYIDCPVDCIMTEWSTWNKSSCSACGPIGIMTRSRRIVASPSDAGQPCPTELHQQMPCDFRPCYYWKHSEWSECDLEGADCGYGVRRRVVECIRDDHLKVDRIHCLVVNVTFTGWTDPYWLAAAQENSHEEEMCTVPCPGDCIMSEWTSWNHCHKNCRAGQEVGYQTSSRHILFVGDNHSANSCPLPIWRTKPCWSDNCDMFSWKLRNDTYICEDQNGVAVQGGCSSQPRPCFKSCEKLGGTCDTSVGICFCENSKGERVMMVNNSSYKCREMKKSPRSPANHWAPTQEIKYYPDDSQVSIWMYAMISIGTAFVIFVAITVYLMCRSSLRQRTVSVERQPSVRRRLNGAATEHTTLETTPDLRPQCTR